MLASDRNQSLSRSIGTEDATRVAIAYDRAISILSLNDPFYAPSREVRRHILVAILTCGRTHGFDEDRLTLAALAAVRIKG